MPAYYRLYTIWMNIKGMAWPKNLVWAIPGLFLFAKKVLPTWSDTSFTFRQAHYGRAVTITSKTTFNNDQPRSGKEKDLWLETLWKKVNCLKGKSQYTGLLRKRHACTLLFRHCQSINVIQRTPLKGGTSEPSIIYYPCLNAPKIPFPTC